jgi:hypothetical protein
MAELTTLNFDVHFEISKYLDLEDVIHLTQTCRNLRTLLNNVQLARRIVEVSQAGGSDLDLANEPSDKASTHRRSSIGTTGKDNIYGRFVCNI